MTEFFNLQRIILGCLISFREPASISSLMFLTGRSRVTVLQSVRTLEKKRLVTIEKVGTGNGMLLINITKHGELVYEAANKLAVLLQ